MQAPAILQRMKALLAQQFDITDVTIQCELEPCDQANEEIHFFDAGVEHDMEDGLEHENAHGHA